MNYVITILLALLFIAPACAVGQKTIPAGPNYSTSEQRQNDAVAPELTPLSSYSEVPSKPPQIDPEASKQIFTREEALSNAKNVIETDSTYRFDGISTSLKFEGEKTLLEGRTWEFIYTFESRYAGYGDRAGKVAASVITPHKVRIVVTGGVVTKATMDEKWDMLERKSIDGK